MIKFIQRFICASLVLLLPIVAVASDPVNTVRSVADQMIAQLKSHSITLKQNPKLVYSLTMKIIVPHASITEMSKRVLPPSVWQTATASQRAQFQKEFTIMLVRTYASALAEYKDQTLHFYPLRGGVEGSSVKVDSQIERSDGPSIAVSYRLARAGSDWKLYDLIVEGVSLLESFRSQFADQLAQGNINTLLQQMHNHNSG